MTDIHCHLLYDIDDGCRDIDESVIMLSKMKEIGFDNVIITPHYIEQHEYSENNKGKNNRLKEIKKRLEEENIDINVYLGNEIFINDNIPNLIKKEEILPLNNRDYVLVEFPFSNMIFGVYDILDDIKEQGYIPIIAHPERYYYFQDNYKMVDELKKDGVLFQCNYSSITGHYGKEAKKLLKYMIKKRYVNYLGTDIHNLNRMDTIQDFSKIDKLFTKWAGKDYYQEIKNNCDSLVK